MCRKVTCRQCGKPTWAGCGAHVDQVLGDVAHADRCSRDHEQARRVGVFARLFGR